MKSIGVSILLFLCIPQVRAQVDSTEPKLEFSGYMDIYYGYDLNRPENNALAPFYYNYNRVNEVTVNFAYLKAAYHAEKLRAQFSLMAGTYPQANQSSEPGLLQHVYEANAGVRLVKNLWLDAGIFDSHIGFESAVSKDCWNLSRSILGENSPYYESGAKLTYTPGSRWLFSGMVLNGWQRITRVNGNTTPAFGTQVTFTPQENMTLNWSTFIGNDLPDSLRQMRYFNDLYGIFNITDQWGITAAFDFGIEQKTAKSSTYNAWNAEVLILRYLVNDKFALAGRMEKYTDRNSVVVKLRNGMGLNTSGYSANVDYTVSSHALIRIEGKYLQDESAIFLKTGNYTHNDVLILSSFVISF